MVYDESSYISIFYYRFIIIFPFSVQICGIFLIVVPLIAQAQIVEIPNPLKYGDIPSILKAITGLLRIIAIPIALIMIIVGGIQIMTGMATGEKEKKVLTGKKTLKWAIIGLAIVLAADFIMGFIKEILGKIE